jgi:hypothetical protein
MVIGMLFAISRQKGTRNGLIPGNIRLLQFEGQSGRHEKPRHRGCLQALCGTPPVGARLNHRTEVTFNRIHFDQRLSGKSSGNIIWSWKRRGRGPLGKRRGRFHFPTTLRRLLFQHGQTRACFCACNWRTSRAFALSRTKSLCATAMRTTLGGLLAVRRRFSIAMKSGS